MSYLRSIILFFAFSIPISLSFAQQGYVAGSPRIAYWRIENKGRPTVITLHGGPGATHNYLRPEWDLLSEYATVVFYDQRGAGKSDTAQCYSWREHVGDLARLIATVAPDQKVILAGSSWGVDLALLFAQTYPSKIKGLILTGLTPWKGRGDPEKPCDLYDYEEPRINREVFQAGLEDYLRREPGMRAKLDSTRKVDSLLRLDPDSERSLMEEKNISGVKEVQFETISSLADAPRFSDLSLEVACIIFQGTDPCFFSDVSKMIAERIKHAHIVYVPASCHDPWVVNPKLFFAECGQFIKGLE